MTDYSKYKFFATNVEDGIATIKFNRPEKLNACSASDHDEMPLILRELAGDPEVRATVVTGEGRGFSVGGDLDMIEDVYNGDADEMNQLLFSAREIINAHLSMDKPIIAAINGHAMGAGAAFGLLCDFIILEEHALIADGHIRAALAAGDGGAIIWPLAMGITKAKKYLLTGDWITAIDAERFGLVTEVVPRGTSLERALAIARRLADGPQSAIRYTKQALNSWLKVGLAGGFEQSLALEGLTMKLDDVPKALKSLRETSQGAIAPEDRR